MYVPAKWGCPAKKHGLSDAGTTMHLTSGNLCVSTQRARGKIESIFHAGLVASEENRREREKRERERERVGEGWTELLWAVYIWL